MEIGCPNDRKSVPKSAQRNYVTITATTVIPQKTWHSAEIKSTTHMFLVPRKRG